MRLSSEIDCCCSVWSHQKSVFVGSDWVLCSTFKQACLFDQRKFTTFLAVCSHHNTTYWSTVVRTLLLYCEIALLSLKLVWTVQALETIFNRLHVKCSIKREVCSRRCYCSLGWALRGNSIHRRGSQYASVVEKGRNLLGFVVRVVIVWNYFLFKTVPCILFINRERTVACKWPVRTHQAFRWKIVLKALQYSCCLNAWFCYCLLQLNNFIHLVTYCLVCNLVTNNWFCDSSQLFLNVLIKTVPNNWVGLQLDEIICSDVEYFCIFFA